MRRIALLMVTATLASSMLVTPSASAQTIVPAAEAQAAVDAALAYAATSGMTYDVYGSVRQRNAASAVAVSVVHGTVSQMILREDGEARMLVPYANASKHASIIKTVREAYGLGPKPFSDQKTFSPDEAQQVEMWFEPFSAFVGMPTAEVVIDSEGRATEVRVNGATALTVLAWNAPLAVRPASNRITDLDTWMTMTWLESLADVSKASIDSLASRASDDIKYRSAPAATLRRYARAFGWTFRQNGNSLIVTTTDALGGSWKAVYVPAKDLVRVASYTLVSRPKDMTGEEAYARYQVGAAAVRTVDLISCAKACSLSGKPSPLTNSNTRKTLLFALQPLGITRQTPGPEFPAVTDGMVGSFGLTFTSKRVRGSVSLSSGGVCSVIPAVGPGTFKRPTSYKAKPGQVGPLGTCV